MRLHAHRMLAHGPLELADEGLGHRGGPEILGPRTPVDHQAAAEALLGMGVGRIEHDAFAPSLVQQPPEGRPAIEAGVEALPALHAGCRLKGEVDAMLARPHARIERGQGRDVQLLGGRGERPAAPPRDQPTQSGQAALLGPAQEQRTVAELEPDDEKLRPLIRHYAHPLTITTEAPRITSAASMLT